MSVDIIEREEVQRRRRDVSLRNQQHPGEAPADEYEGKPWIRDPRQLSKVDGVVWLGHRMFANPKLPSKAELSAMSEKDLVRLAQDLNFRPKGPVSTLSHELLKVVEAQKHIQTYGFSNFETNIKLQPLLERAITLFPYNEEVFDLEKRYEQWRQ